MTTCQEQSERIQDWPNCSVPDCPNKICIRLHSGKCWPHTMHLPINFYEKMSEKEIEVFTSQKEAEYFNG